MSYYNPVYVTDGTAFEIKSSIKKWQRAMRATIGILIALLLTFGYKADEVYKKIGRMNFSFIQDDNFGIAGDLIRIDENDDVLYLDNVVDPRFIVIERQSSKHKLQQAAQSFAKAFATKRVPNGSLFMKKIMVATPGVHPELLHNQPGAPPVHFIFVQV